MGLGRALEQKSACVRQERAIHNYVLHCTAGCTMHLDSGVTQGESCTEASKPKPHSWLGHVVAVTSMYRRRHNQTVTPGVPW